MDRPARRRICLLALGGPVVGLGGVADLGLGEAGGLGQAGDLWLDVPGGVRALPAGAAPLASASDEAPQALGEVSRGLVQSGRGRGADGGRSRGALSSG